MMDGARQSAVTMQLHAIMATITALALWCLDPMTTAPMTTYTRVRTDWPFFLKRLIPGIAKTLILEIYDKLFFYFLYICLKVMCR